MSFLIVQIIIMTIIISSLLYKYYQKKLAWFFGLFLTLTFGLGFVTWQLSDMSSGLACPENKKALCTLSIETINSLFDNPDKNSELIIVMNYLSFNIRWGWLLWLSYFISIAIFVTIIRRVLNKQST